MNNAIITRVIRDSMYLYLDETTLVRFQVVERDIRSIGVLIYYHCVSLRECTAAYILSTYTYIIACVYVCVGVCVNVHMFAYVCVNVHVCMWVCANVHMFAYVCVNVHVCRWVYVCDCGYVYRCLIVKIYRKHKRNILLNIIVRLNIIQI